MKFTNEIVWEIACSIDEAENCTKVTGFERKLRPEWAKKQDLAVKSEGACWVRGKNTARMGEKARFGRKIGGGLLGSREKYGQNGRKSKIWP